MAATKDFFKLKEKMLEKYGARGQVYSANPIAQTGKQALLDEKPEKLPESEAEKEENADA